MSKDPILICLPDDYPVLKPPGSLPMKCTECPTIVSVSPSSWRILHDHPEVKVVCYYCSLSHPGNLVQPASPDQLDDMAEALKEAGD